MLAEGDYAIYTEPTLDTDLDAATDGAGPRSGFPVVYYPDAREPSGIARVHVASGQESQANFSLTLEPFQIVTAKILIPPGGSAGRAGANVSAIILDTAGHPLPYRAQYDEQTRQVRTELPDGNYTLLVEVVPFPERSSSGGSAYSRPMSGSIEVTIAGRPVSNLRIPISAQRPNPVQVIVHRVGATPAPPGPVNLLVSPAQGWLDDNMVSEFATGNLPGPLEPVYTRPGVYWVRTQNQPGLCVEIAAAGGTDLAREPLVVGLSGSTAPIELTLRDDCASLELSLPDAQASIAAGEEPFFTVYAVPDVPSTSDVQPAILRASTGGTMTLSGLTPGSYHVYTFVGAVEMPYRNREALAAFKNSGQAISLAPGTTGNLVVEAPAL
jgi:hypothetical protein